MKKKQRIIRLPSVDKAGVMAVAISEHVRPRLNDHEQAYFVAGFQECIKWLSRDIVTGETICFR